MNGDVAMASAYNDHENGIHIENHSGSGRSGDFMDVDLLEEEPCIKCNRRDENLLVCSQSGCLISVHENCLSCGVEFDDVGNFYRPYCWYKCELMRTKELRKKAMETKKKLACFIDSKSFSGDKKKENCRTDKANELSISSLHEERNYGYGGCEDRMDDVQVEDLIVEVEFELENDGDNAKTADSCDRFKRALESQSDPLAVHSHPGDKINNSRDKTPGIGSLVNYTSKERPIDMRRLFKTNCKKSLTQLYCVGEENIVDILLNLWKGDIPDTEKLREEKQEEENVDPRTLRNEMSDSDIEPMSMRLRCVA
ncbi:hypothetical protein KPL70_004103 [Citrus sinensis]|nr:hypothetical protein KPL70_004103 [Citrus sinensis]